MSKRVYLYESAGGRPVALVDAPVVGGPFPAELRGRPQPVIEWQGYIFYWHEQSGGYRRWVLKRDLARIDDVNVVATFGASTG